MEETKLPQEVPPNDNTEEVIEGSIVPFKGDEVEVIVHVAQQLEVYEKALNAIMNFIVRRTYPGDWCSHDKQSTPLEERTVNMIGAAAERIARDLGIQELNRTTPVKTWNEKFPGHYQYQCEGDFSFRGRTVHAIGIASTRNPFYARAYGEDKKPEEIREEYIVRECLRDCTKQGVKGLLGLRKIPILKLRDLGYDISKVKYVNFKSSEKSSTETSPESTAVPEGAEKPESNGEVITITIEAMEPKLSKNKKPFFVVKDAEGSSFFSWGDGLGETNKYLLKCMKEKKPVKIEYEKKDGFSTVRGVFND